MLELCLVLLSRGLQVLKMILLRHGLLLSALILVCSGGIWTCLAESAGVPQGEGKKTGHELRVWCLNLRLALILIYLGAVDALQQAIKTMGSTAGEFNVSSCDEGGVDIGVPPAQSDQKAESKVYCSCSNGTCHIVALYVFSFFLCFYQEEQLK